MEVFKNVVPDGTQFIEANIGWIIQIAIIFGLTIVAGIATGLILRRVESRFLKTRTFWDNAIIRAIRTPVQATIWIVGLSHVGEMLQEQMDVALLASVPLLREILLTLLVGWSLMRLINEGSKAFVEGRRKRGRYVELTTVDAVGNILKACAFVTTALLMLQTLGYSLNAVLTFGGISGVAVGFAAKDLLANFFGAIMVYYDKPFKIGDWIRSPDREIQGVVEKIGWRMTTIRTFDKRPLYLPNAIFTQIAVENPSRMTHRRIYETIGIRYDDLEHMQGITDDVREMLQKHQEIDSTHTLMVFFNEFGDSSCNFFIYCFTRTTDWAEYHSVKHEVLLTVANIVSSYGAQIAYPTRTLHLTGQMPGIEPVAAKTGDYSPAGQRGTLYGEDEGE